MQCIDEEIEQKLPTTSVNTDLFPNCFFFLLVLVFVFSFCSCEKLTNKRRTCKKKKCFFCCCNRNGSRCFYARDFQIDFNVSSKNYCT